MRFESSLNIFDYPLRRFENHKKHPQKYIRTVVGRLDETWIEHVTLIRHFIISNKNGRERDVYHTNERRTNPWINIDKKEWTKMNERERDHTKRKSTRRSILFPRKTSICLVTDWNAPTNTNLIEFPQLLPLINHETETELAKKHSKNWAERRTQVPISSVPFVRRSQGGLHTSSHEHRCAGWNNQPSQTKSSLHDRYWIRTSWKRSN